MWHILAQRKPWVFPAIGLSGFRARVAGGPPRAAARARGLGRRVRIQRQDMAHRRDRVALRPRARRVLAGRGEVLPHEPPAEFRLDARPQRVVAGNAQRRSQRFQQAAQRPPAHDQVAVVVDEGIVRRDRRQLALRQRRNVHPPGRVHLADERVRDQGVADVGRMHAVQAEQAAVVAQQQRHVADHRRVRGHLFHQRMDVHHRHAGRRGILDDGPVEAADRVLDGRDFARIQHPVRIAQDRRRQQARPDQQHRRQAGVAAFGQSVRIAQEQFEVRARKQEADASDVRDVGEHDPVVPAGQAGHDLPVVVREHVLRRDLAGVHVVERERGAEHVVVADPADGQGRAQALRDPDLGAGARQFHQVGFVDDRPPGAVGQDRIAAGAGNREVGDPRARIDARTADGRADHAHRAGADQRQRERLAHLRRDQRQVGVGLGRCVGVGRLHALADAVAQPDQRRRFGLGRAGDGEEGEYG